MINFMKYSGRKYHFLFNNKSTFYNKSLIIRTYIILSDLKGIKASLGL